MRDQRSPNRNQWSPNDVAEVGRQIYESVPNDQRPSWAGAILGFAVEITKTDLPELKEVLAIAADATCWGEAHDAFYAVRKRTLENEKAGRDQSIQQLVLDIGETVAKIVYNASGDFAPFDYDAGWHLAPRLKYLADQLGDEQVEERCWRLLIRSA